MSRALKTIIEEIGACRVCAAALPHEPRPVVWVDARARILIAGQAPGNVRLTLLVGVYAQRYHLGAAVKRTLGETVRAWRDYPANVMPLPHPSWRNTGWLKRNLWFEKDLLPELRRRVSSALR